MFQVVLLLRVYYYTVHYYRKIAKHAGYDYSVAFNTYIFKAFLDLILKNYVKPPDLSI